MVTCLQQLHPAVWKLCRKNNWSILKIECSSQHQLSSDPTGVLLKVSYDLCVVWRCLSAAGAGNLISTSRHQMTPCPHQHMPLHLVHCAATKMFSHFSIEISENKRYEVSLVKMFLVSFLSKECKWS